MAENKEKMMDVLRYVDDANYRCRVCESEWYGKHGQRKARDHAEKTGHKVRGEIIKIIVYNPERGS